jgi:hypothetical protein
MSNTEVDIIYDYNYWLKRQWALEDQKANIAKAKEQLRAYSASRQLNPSYVFNQDIDRRLDELAVKTKELDSYVSKRMKEIRAHSASRTLTKQEIQRINIEKTLELTAHYRRPIVS